MARLRTERVLPREPAVTGLDADAARAAILAVIASIPAGRVASYGQVAWIAGLPGRARLVGRVLSSFPASIPGAIHGETALSSATPGPAIPGRAQLTAASNARDNAVNCPWHRVINAKGEISLPKFSPSYREQKRRLRAEGVVFVEGRVSLRRFGWHAGDDSPLID